MAIIDRLFGVLFSVILVITALWIFYTRTVLQDSGTPTTIVRLFDRHNDLLYNIVTIFSIILLLLSNLFYWRTGNRAYFLCSIFYFVAGVVSLAILENARFYYTKLNGVWNHKLSAGFVVSVYLIVIVIGVTAVDFLIISSLRKRALAKRKNYDRIIGRRSANLG